MWELNNLIEGNLPNVYGISKKYNCSKKYVRIIWRNHPKYLSKKRGFVFDKNIAYRRAYVKATLEYWQSKKEEKKEHLNRFTEIL